MRSSIADQSAHRVSVLVLMTSAIAASVIWAVFLISQQFRPFTYWLQDWHVYAAGARDLLNHQL
jgi:hypothetical protein